MLVISRYVMSIRLWSSRLEGSREERIAPSGIFLGIASTTLVGINNQYLSRKIGKMYNRIGLLFSYLQN